MNISKLIAHLPEEKTHMTRAASIAIFSRIFCGPMKVRGFCKRDCAACVDLPHLFDMEGVDNPAGILTWRLRNELSKISDSRVTQSRKEEDAFGEVELISNPFEQFIQKLDSGN